MILHPFGEWLKFAAGSMRVGLCKSHNRVRATRRAIKLCVARSERVSLCARLRRHIRCGETRPVRAALPERDRHDRVPAVRRNSKRPGDGTGEPVRQSRPVKPIIPEGGTTRDHGDHRVADPFGRHAAAQPPLSGHRPRGGATSRAARRENSRLPSGESSEASGMHRVLSPCRLSLPRRAEAHRTPPRPPRARCSRAPRRRRRGNRRRPSRGRGRHRASRAPFGPRRRP